MKTRIKDIDGLYYPQHYHWGLWLPIVAGVDFHGDSTYFTNSLGDAKVAIDKYLTKNKPSITRIIEYPKPEE